MTPYPSKFQLLKLESLDAQTRARTIRTLSQETRVSAESNRVRSAMVRAWVEEDRARRRGDLDAAPAPR
jgi:hypothetical protein